MKTWRTRAHYSLADGWAARGYLPHFDSSSVFQFITFGLAESEPSLPKRTSNRDSQYVIRLDDERIGPIMCQAIRAMAPARCQLADWVVMPDHVHLLLKTSTDYSLCKLIKGLKSFTSRQIGVCNQTRGRIWARDYFDTFIRDGDHFGSVSEYIRWNPVAKGLVARPEQWPFGSAAGTAGDLTG